MTTTRPDESAAPPIRVPDQEISDQMRSIGGVWVREPLDDAVDPWRLVITPPAAATLGTPLHRQAFAIASTELAQPNTRYMMGNNPALPKMPDRPTLADFYRLRFGERLVKHMLQSARLAKENGMPEKVVMACLLHDIAVAGLLRSDHGYWGAQMVAPYVDEEIAWAIEKHQALRYFPDESVGYTYPDAYVAFFGADYDPPEYIHREYESARNHRWYMTSRLVTIHDFYSFDPNVQVEFDEFTDIVERNFRQPKEGLGFDGSRVAHMWRTMIWPNNAL
jgi:hypothetical protein